MKMGNRFLLGSAAALVAVGGAQAADLPVKAQPTQFVKICSLYGAGFYYVPGTDMCLKIGGWVRAEYAYGDNGNLSWGWANNNANNRTTNNSTWRVRGYIMADARNQTEYGTVRGYLAVGLSTNNTGADRADNTFSANRAFIQWAGFTFGLSQSFYDFYSSPSTSYWGSFPASDTSDGGWMVAGYTAQFGNGFSGTLAAEMRRTTQIIGSQTAAAIPGFTSGLYGGFQAPDLVANQRVDQAWGSAQIMGALHQVNALYYDDGTTVTNGHPSDKWGFVIGAGIRLNAPMIGQGDYLQAQVNYTEGALRYIFQTPNSNWGKVDGNSAAFGSVSDAVYGGFPGEVGVFRPSDLNLTTAWNVNVAYEHFWNPQWRTSLYGGYSAVSYNESATSLICNGELSLSVSTCNMDWNTWWIGSRTQWNITREFYMGFDTMYSKLHSADFGPIGTLASSAAVGNRSFPKDDQDNWQFRFRVHRDFYP